MCIKMHQNKQTNKQKKKINFMKFNPVVCVSEVKGKVLQSGTVKTLSNK